MAKDDPHRIVQIEIEDVHAPTVDPDAPLLGDNSNRPWAALAAVTLLLSALVGVLWVSSAPDRSAQAEEPVPPLTQDLPSIESLDSESSDVADAVEELNPARLDVRLTHVVSFDGALIGLTVAGEQRVPPVLRSEDGVSWEEVGAQVEGPESATEYFWTDLQVVNDEIVVVGIDFDRASDFFVSQDGATWTRYSDEVVPPKEAGVEFDGTAFTLVDAETNDRRTWTLPQGLLGDGNTQDPVFVSKVSVRFLNRYLFEGGDGLWVLDPNTDTWEQISSGVTGHRNLTTSPSSQRLVSVNNGELTAIHVTEAGSQLGLLSCTYALSGVAPEQQLAGTSALVTTEEQVVFAAPTGTWRVEIPTPDSTCDRWIEASRPTAFNEIVATPLAHSEVVLFDGMFIALDSQRVPSSTPPLLQSTDGLIWSPVETSLTDGQGVGLYRWNQLELAGAGLSIVRSGDAFQQASFLSADVSEWVAAGDEVGPVDPLRSFVVTSVTQDSIIGRMAIERGPDDLRIGDDADPADVRLCIRDLGASFFTPDRMLVEFDRERREIEQVALGDSVVDDEIALGDGRVVGVVNYLPVSLPESCEEVVEVPPADSRSLYVMDPNDDSFIEWPLHPSLAGADELQLVGEVSTGSLRRFVLATSEELWSFDPSSQKWGSLGPSFGGQTSTMMSPTGKYLYSLDVDGMQRWLFAQVSADIGMEVCSWPLPQEEPLQSSIGRRDIIIASDDHVGYQAPSETWLLNTESLPDVRERCARLLEQPID